MNTEKEKQMESTYRAVVGLRFPATPDGVKQAQAAQTQDDFATIKWATVKPGGLVPDYIIKASPWLIEQGQVEIGSPSSPEVKPAPSLVVPEDKVMATPPVAPETKVGKP